MCYLNLCVSLQIAATYFAYMTDMQVDSPPASLNLHLTFFISAGPLAALASFLTFFIIISDQ